MEKLLKLKAVVSITDEETRVFVIDVITSKPHFELVIRQRGYSLRNTEGLICSSHTPRVCLHAPSDAVHGSHIRLSPPTGLVNQYAEWRVWRRLLKGFPVGNMIRLVKEGKLYSQKSTFGMYRSDFNIAGKTGTSMCAYYEDRVRGSPALSNWDRIFIQPGPDLDLITPGPMHRADNAYAPDWFSGSNGRGQMDVKERHKIVHDEEGSLEKRSIRTMCSALHFSIFGLAKCTHVYSYVNLD